MRSFCDTVVLESLFEEFQRYSDHDTVIEADFDEVQDILTGEDNIIICRLTQEFLTNAYKHAEATQVRVAIKVFPEKVVVSMAANGKGFIIEEVKSRRRIRGGIGLISMEERLRRLGSHFSLTGQPRQGTRLYFEIPRTPGDNAAEVLEQGCLK